MRGSVPFEGNLQEGRFRRTNLSHENAILPHWIRNTGDSGRTITTETAIFFSFSIKKIGLLRAEARNSKRSAVGERSASGAAILTVLQRAEYQ
jgi:hypothetical protein